MENKYDVFLSYSHLDRHVANELADKLRMAGISCFLAEEDVRAGEQWQSTIRAALQVSERVLLLITPRSKSSKWLLVESGAAWVQGKELIPLMLFVDLDEVTAPLTESQARVIESDSQLQQFLLELRSARRLTSKQPTPPVLTFNDVKATVQEAIEAIHKDRYHPELIVGSGRGGAICAAMFSSYLDNKSLKVVDCSIKGRAESRITRIDDSSLTALDVNGKSILVVETRRQEGKVFSQIKRKLQAEGAGDIRSFVLVLLSSSPSTPDYFGYKLDSVPFLPWTWVAPNLHLTHRSNKSKRK